VLVFPLECWLKISIPWKMERLRSSKLTEPKFKLLVDEKEILTDAVAFYKCPSFDPTRPLRVSFDDQLAIDTGGIVREFFSTVKEKFITEGVFPMFEDPRERLLFNYEPSCHAAEIQGENHCTQPDPWLWWLSQFSSLTLLLYSNW
jgi:hypothetical protein